MSPTYLNYVQCKNDIEEEKGKKLDTKELLAHVPLGSKEIVSGLGPNNIDKLQLVKEDVSTYNLY